MLLVALFISSFYRVSKNLVQITMEWTTVSKLCEDKYAKTAELFPFFR